MVLEDDALEKDHALALSQKERDECAHWTHPNQSGLCRSKGLFSNDLRLVRKTIYDDRYVPF